MDQNFQNWQYTCAVPVDTTSGGIADEESSNPFYKKMYEPAVEGLIWLAWGNGSIGIPMVPMFLVIGMLLQFYYWY